jgi:parvulin-like peptidyl-prolyl isomerase
MILSELRALQRRVVGMDSELRKTVKELKKVRKELADLYTDSQPPAEGDVDDDDDTESAQVDDKYPGFIPQIDVEKANRIALIAQEKRQKELEAEQKENLRKAMMICR